MAFALAIFVALLAFWSPIDRAGADAAIALLVSQNLLRHGTFDLARVADDPLLSYDLKRDYRIFTDGRGGYFYHSYGVPLVSLPAVALANVAGLDMRQQESEFRLQNLLSALVCAVLFLLLYRLLSYLVDPPTALVVTLVSTLGSPLVSTLATGLWNTGYQLLFLLGALILLVRRRPTPILALLVLVAVAAICRPTTGFFAIALLFHLFRTSERRDLRWASGIGLVGIASMLALAAFGVAGWLPRYYDPSKLFKNGDALQGALGVLVSPSRGFLVYSPFLVIVLFGVAVTIRRIWRRPLVQLSIVWILAHGVAIAFKGTWWGGHAFGPRLLAEIVPALAIVTVFAWRELRCTPQRRLWALAYLGAGSVAIAIHSIAGLFNPWAVKWNERPNIDAVHEEIFDWSYPQFLATEDSVTARDLEIQGRIRRPYGIGETIGSTSRAVVFEGWSPAEGPWRWSRERFAAIHLELEEEISAPLFLLEIKAGTLGTQRVGIRWNRKTIRTLSFDGFAPQVKLLALPGTLLQEGENHLLFSLPDAGPSAEDPRLLGIALHTFRIQAIPWDFRGFDHSTEVFFRSGFGEDESSWRWTNGPAARIWVPIVRPPSREDPELRLVTAAFGHQEVELFWDSVALATLEVEGFEPVEIRVPLDPDLLEVGVLHDLELRIRSPAQTPGDSRRLGLALVSLGLEGF